MGTNGERSQCLAERRWHHSPHRFRRSQALGRLRRGFLGRWLHKGTGGEGSESSHSTQHCTALSSLHRSWARWTRTLSTSSSHMGPRWKTVSPLGCSGDLQIPQHTPTVSRSGGRPHSRHEQEKAWSVGVWSVRLPSR